VQGISPEAFCECMRARWVSELGNVYTPKLGRQWAELANVFNDHIAAHDDPSARERYTVVAAALGSGKTQGTALYCAMLAEALSDEDQPGVLIVTRRIEDAEDIADTINRLAGREKFATAYHSEIAARSLKLADLAKHPVLIVTHRGYQLALDRLSQEGEGASRWPEFSRFGAGHRKLNCIDEALELVEHDSLTVESLKDAIAGIPEQVRRRFPDQCEILEETLAHFRSPDAFKIPDGRRAAIWKFLKAGGAPDLSELRAEIGRTVFPRRWGMTGEEIRTSVRATLGAAERMFRQWAYVMRLPTEEHVLHTARLILPPNTKGAVILDATAKANTLYRLFGDRVQLRSLPFSTRDYRNVRLHVSRGHKTGKRYIVENADAAAREILANLQDHLPRNRRALIVTHKDAEVAFAKYDTPFRKYTAHWQAIDGSNDWRDCDAICIASLPRRPDSWANSSYFAITGDVRDEVLGDDGDEVRRSIRIGQVVSDVAQAVGRIRCRKVVDEAGNCDPVDVFLVLPEGREGDEILAGLLQFPGVVVYEWRYSGTATKMRVRASKIEEAFLVAARALPKGRTTAKDVRAALNGHSQSSWERLAALLRNPKSRVAQAVADLDIVFLPGSKGRGGGATFHRA
jgi:hypothetical protein